MRKKASFGERFAKNGCQFAIEAWAIHRFRLLSGQTANGSLLDELAFESKEGRQSVVPRLQCLYLFRNSKQLAQEILDMRGQFDHQLGLLFSRPCPWIAARVEQPGAQPGVRR